MTNKRLAQGFQMVVTNVPALLMQASKSLLQNLER
jgi:hypothetical protein